MCETTTVDRINAHFPSGKRATRKDKPKRPLSAFNYFFKEEREKILKILRADDPYKVEQDPSSQDFLSDQAITSLAKEGDKVFFEQMGKIIGTRWKDVDPDRLAKFSELAGDDTERYEKEMQSYNGPRKEKVRSEKVAKPQACQQHGLQGGVPAGPDPGHQPYPEMNHAYAAQGYGAYGMDPYAVYGSPYATYASYPPMGDGSPEQMGENPYSRGMYAQPGMAQQYQMG